MKLVERGANANARSHVGRREAGASEPRGRAE
jgi:hypothetical protein